jgi:hypothetical protein
MTGDGNGKTLARMALAELRRAGFLRECSVNGISKYELCRAPTPAEWEALHPFLRHAMIVIVDHVMHEREKRHSIN